MKNPADMTLQELIDVRNFLQQIGSEANETLINTTQHLLHIENRIAMVVGLPPLGGGEQQWNESWIEKVENK